MTSCWFDDMMTVMIPHYPPMAMGVLPQYATIVIRRDYGNPSFKRAAPTAAASDSISAILWNTFRRSFNTDVHDKLPPP